MKILVLSQYFWPETFIINDLVKNLDAQGHAIAVATAKPNYPSGRIFEGYTAWGIQKEQYNGVELYRVPIWPRGKGKALNLVLNYLSFVFSGVIFFPWLLMKKEFDVILVFASSPITSAIPAIFLKWFHRAHLAIWVQDLWPDSLEATGWACPSFS